MLTPNEIRQMLAEIREQAGDPEAAHSLEDAVWVATLRAIALGVPEPQKLAEEALRSIEIEFPRWYA